jgi:hypothetical protein
LKLKATFIAATLIAAIPSLYAQVLTAAKLQVDRVEVGSLANLVIDFKSENTTWCGLVIDWGSGDRPQTFRIGEDDKKTSPIMISRTYLNSGTFSISVKGQFVSRGLKSAVPCEGAAIQTQVVVLDPVAEAKIKSAEIERQQSIRKAEEEKTKAEADKFLLEKRLAELAQKELELKQRELDIREAELRRVKPLAIQEIESKPESATVRLTEAERRQKIVEEREQAQRERQLKAKAEKEAAEEARKKLAEEKERAIAAKRQEAAEERAKQQEAKEEAERRKREEIEAERQRVITAKAELERVKRQAIEAALVRPLISNQDPRIQCQSGWDLDPQYQPIASKISLTSMTDINFQMLADNSQPTSKERQSIANLADAFTKCVNESNAFRRANYNPEALSLLVQEDTKILELKLDLYNRKLTYSKYNQSIKQIASQTKNQLETLADRLKAEQDRLKAEQAKQQDLSRARAAAMRDAQQRQDQQRMADQRREEQRRQAEQSRIAAVRQQWQARCELDKRNAYEQYTKSKENSWGGPNRGLAVLCAFGNVAAANDYADAAFKSCMSGAPIQ